jgi:branched-chain amino acid transport system permease protein
MKQPTRRDFVKRTLLIGIVCALAAIYTVAVGIVTAFEARPLVTGVLGLGVTVPLLIILVISYYAGTTPRDWLPTKGLAHRIVAPIAVGAMGGAGLAFLIVLNEFSDPREVLPRLTAQTAQIIGLGNDFPVGALMIVALGASLGLLAAILHLIAAPARRALVIAFGTVIVFGLIEPLLRVMLLQLGTLLGNSLPNQLANFLYQSRGLTLTAAVVIFGLVLALALAWQYRGSHVKRRYGALPSGQRTGVQVATIVVLAVILLLLPSIVGTFLSETLGTVGLYLLMGLGLNIVVGYAGLLDLGYVAFFAVGAYATAMLTSPASSLGLELNFWLALPIVMLVAAITGIAIGAPVLRLRGDYLAIVTLGFGEIVRIILLSDWLRPVFGGAQGILQIPAPTLGDRSFFDPTLLYYPILAAVALAALVSWSLARSRVGRAWNAMREDEDVAEATGINTTRYKLLAFAIGATFGCVAGAFFSIKIGSVFPQRLDILISITVLSLIILGGMGSIRGVIVGAVVLVGLPELLREFGEYRLLIYGVVLVSMMLLRPEGLLPSATRKRELHEEEPEEVQYLKQAGGDTRGPGIATA